MQKLVFRAMGCQMLAVVDTDAVPAADGLMHVPEWFEAWEAALSRFRPESELSRLNRAAGAPVPVSDVLWTVLDAALKAARQSAGLVTPTLLDALTAAGYDRSFDALERRQPALATPVVMPDWRTIRRDERARTVCLPAGLKLDFGGIAKGWAAAEAARRLSAFGPALVDAGGDVAVSGPMADGQAWPVAVADPITAGQQADLVLIASGGVATSGRDHRRWQQGGVWQHHILDPRTGRPAVTDALSVTVIAPNILDAEVAAKMVLIQGSQAGLAWLDARPKLAALIALENGRVLRSRRFAAHTWQAPTNLQGG